MKRRKKQRKREASVEWTFVQSSTDPAVIGKIGGLQAWKISLENMQTEQGAKSAFWSIVGQPWATDKCLDQANDLFVSLLGHFDDLPKGGAAPLPAKTINAHAIAHKKWADAQPLLPGGCRVFDPSRHKGDKGCMGEP